MYCCLAGRQRYKNQARMYVVFGKCNFLFLEENVMKNLMKIVLVMGILAVLSSSAQANLLLHWAFDEAAGATTAADTGPSGIYTAINGGGTPVFGAAGISGNAVQFDGVDDWLQLPYTTDLVNASFTLSFWVNEDAATVNQWWLNFGSTHPVYPNVTGGNQEAGWQMFHRGSSSAPRLDYRLGGYRETDSKYGWFLGNTVNLARDTGWHHMVVTVEATGVTEVLGGRTYYRVNRANYVDGQRITLDTPGVTTPDVVGEDNILYLPGPTQLVPLAIGARVENMDGTTPISNGWYKGLIDEVQYYTNALSADEIAYLYANPGAAVPEPATLIVLALGGAAFLRRRHA